MIEEKIKQEFDIFKDPALARKESEDYAMLLELYDSYPIIEAKEGEILNSIYQGINQDEYLFSVAGLKDDIRIENRPSESKYIESLEIGDSIDVLISNVNNSPFTIKGSISELYESRAHHKLKSLNSNEFVMCYVKSMNPAGYDVEVMLGNVVLPGFMPNTLAGINKLHDPEYIVDQTFEVMIESYSDKEGTYIVSRKKYLQSLIVEESSKLQFDEVYTGYVTGTAPFGVFVEFNECLTGMIHKVNLREDWQDRIDEIVPGFEVDFYIKEVIKEKGKKYPKIILTQIIRESLWDSIEIGQVINAKVKDNKKFGVLVYLDDETIGLIHTSELSKLKKSLNPDDKINVKVLSLDRMNRKIFLTLA